MVLDIEDDQDRF